MLRYLRVGSKHTKAIWWLLTVVTVVTFLGGFVFLFGMGAGSGEVGGRPGVLGVVDGAPITGQEFQTALATQRDAFRRQYGSEPSDMDEKNVEMQAWRSLVTQKMLARAARQAGIKSHDREVVLTLETSPPPELATQPEFQTDGKFDPEKYRAALRNPNLSWAPFEELTRRQLPVRKLEERMMSSLKLSEPELAQAYHERFDRASATVVAISPDLTAKLPPPQPADLDRVYQEYKGRFNAGPRVDLEILVVQKKYSDEDVRVARQTAQILVDRIRKGEDFAQLAKDNSEGPAADRGGVIDRTLQLADLGPDLGPKVGALQPGQVTDALPGPGRFVILKLLERVPQPGQPTPGLRLAQIIVRIHPTEDELRAQGDELQKLRSRARTLKSLGKAAAEKGLATARTGYFDPNSPPQGLATVPEAADWAYGAKQGEVSPVFEGTDEYAIAQVAARHESGPVSRDMLGETLRQIAEMEARVDRAKPVADRLAGALAQGRPLEEAARELGLTAFTVKDMTRAQPDPRLSAAPELVGSLFGTTPGHTVGPIREPAGWYFARLDARTLAPMDSTFEKTKGALASEILATRQRTFFSSWLEDLRMKAKVQDMRLSPSR